MPETDKNERNVTVDFNIRGAQKWAETMFDVEYHNFIVGLNSAIGGAISTLCYDSLSSIAARITLPTLCGYVASKLWRDYLTNPLRRGYLDCPVCVTTRGMAIAFSSATLLPGIIGGALLVVRSRGHASRGVTFVQELTGPYRRSISKHPLLAAAIITQVSLGFIMADREFDHFMRKLYSESEVRKGRRIEKKAEDEISPPSE